MKKTIRNSIGFKIFESSFPIVYQRSYQNNHSFVFLRYLIIGGGGGFLRTSRRLGEFEILLVFLGGDSLSSVAGLRTLV